MNEMMTPLNKCPLCGRLPNLNIKAGTAYNNGTCIDYHGEIECECGLLLEREWTKMRAKDGYILRDEDVFTAWNRLTSIKPLYIEPIKKSIPETQDIETIRKDALRILRTECIGDSEFMELAKQLGADALAKEIPQKPNNKATLSIYGDITSHCGVCPSCNEFQYFAKLPNKKTYIHRCGECGQALDWGDDNA